MKSKTFQLQLKIVWFKNFLGLAIDQLSVDQQYSLTPYYFWPRTEAWEQLKLELDSKLWISQEEKVQILKTASDVMKYWLDSRDKKTADDLKEAFKEINVLKIQA